MPNLEFHGFDTISPLLRAKIKSLFEDAPYFKEMVLSYQGSYVVNLHDYKKAPFIRVWATNQKEVDDVIKRLDPLDIDIELPPLLDKFILRKSERAKLLEKLKAMRPVSGTDPDFDYEKEKPSNIQETVDRAAENLKRDLGPYPVTQSKMLD